MTLYVVTLMPDPPSPTQAHAYGGDNPSFPVDAKLQTDGYENQAEIQALYSAHRVKRNKQQQDKFLSAEFKELVIDPFLLRLERPEIEPGFRDPRNCLVYWARPPDHVIRLAVHLQTLLKKAAPSEYPYSSVCR
jgi:hypothetical protein